MEEILELANHRNGTKGYSKERWDGLAKEDKRALYVTLFCIASLNILLVVSTLHGSKGYEIGLALVLSILYSIILISLAITAVNQLLLEKVDMDLMSLVHSEITEFNNSSKYTYTKDIEPYGIAFKDCNKVITSLLENDIFYNLSDRTYKLNYIETGDFELDRLLQEAYIYVEDPKGTLLTYNIVDGKLTNPTLVSSD